ncbi:hypothetical protein AAMO2058_001419900 [Amorphochlora amoebiformis]
MGDVFGKRESYHQLAEDFFYPSANALTNARKAGWLYRHKEGFCGFFTRWRRRWVVLQGGYLFEFRNAEAKRPLGLPIEVTETHASIHQNNKRKGELRYMRLSGITGHQVYCADDEHVLELWIHAIQAAKEEITSQRLVDQGTSHVTQVEESPSKKLNAHQRNG